MGRPEKIRRLNPGSGGKLVGSFSERDGQQPSTTEAVWSSHQTRSNNPQPTYPMANTFPSSGNAGIGTTGPNAPLEVVGKIIGGDGTFHSDNVEPLFIGQSDSGGGTLLGAVFNRAGGPGSGSRGLAIGITDANSGDTSTLTGAVAGMREDAGNNYKGGVALYVNDNSGNPSYAVSTMTRAMSILSSGNVGIGITSPTAKLHVNGAAKVDGAGTFLGKVACGDQTCVNDNVEPLFIGQGDSGGGTLLGAVFSRAGGSAGGSRGLAIAFSNANASDYSTLTGAIAGIIENSGYDYKGGLAFYVNNNGGNPSSAVSTMTQAMSLLSSGNLGIGIAVPTAKLHVNGDTILAGGQSCKVSTISSNTTLDGTYHTVLVSTSAGSTITVTLPSASAHSGREYRIKNKGAGITQIAGTVDGNSGGLLVGGKNDAVTLVSDGSGWFIF